jgi:hypothetical protein
MILQLRQRHRLFVIMLAALIPILFAWGILRRKGLPMVRPTEATPIQQPGSKQ